MTHRPINPARWRAILAQQSPHTESLLYLWTATFVPEAFDAPLVESLLQAYREMPSPDLEYALALLNAEGTPLKAPPFHAHLAFVVHRVGFNAKMLEALSEKPAATAILLFAMSQGHADDKLPWLRRWLTALPAKSARALILRALINGAPVSNPFQPLHLQTLSHAWLLAAADEAAPAEPSATLSTETIWKRLQAHPITKPWIRLRPSTSQAAPVSGPVTIQ
jgi:hypothetical protein